MKARRERGVALVEMSLISLPILLTLFGTFQMARGMWLYHTSAYAVREAVRFAIVHGQDCQYDPPAVTNSCSKAKADIASVVQQAGVGLDPSHTMLTFCTGACASNPGVTCALNACDSTEAWPPVGSNDVGDPIEIDIQTPFTWGLGFSTNLKAASSDRIQF
jgi:Flp pilus assembly protein TadG